jgi:D-alanyl-D-alanine endopeptidase (penicillin-binding protein 7)
MHAPNLQKILENTALTLYFSSNNCLAATVLPSAKMTLKKLLLALAACISLHTGPALSQPAGVERPLDPVFAAKAGHLNLKSSSVLVLEQNGGHTLYAKNTEAVVPIASITKLMTAMVVLDSRLPLHDLIMITDEDVDQIKHTRSRLTLGTALPRDELLHVALMASENRAASALARSYPGGLHAFVAAMNQKSVELGMWRTRFVDGTGLSSDNVSTAQDLAKMVEAAYRYPLIREFTTGTTHAVTLRSGRPLAYRNSNGLIKSAEWTIGLSKTGYISEAGRCLVMQAKIAATPVIIVLLDSWGKQTRMGDANRIKKWIESQMIRQRPG